MKNGMSAQTPSPGVSINESKERETPGERQTGVGGRITAASVVYQTIRDYTAGTIASLDLPTERGRA